MVDLPLRIGYAKPRDFGECRPIVPEGGAAPLESYRSGLGVIMERQMKASYSNMLGGGQKASSSSSAAPKKNPQKQFISASSNSIDLRDEVYTQIVNDANAFAKQAAARMQKNSVTVDGGKNNNLHNNTAAASGNKNTRARPTYTAKAVFFSEPESEEAVLSTIQVEQPGKENRIPQYTNPVVFTSGAPNTAQTTFDDHKRSRMGLLSLPERRIQEKLQKRMEIVDREKRFDSLMKSDGTFKRQVWASMIKEGLIGYNKTSKKAQVEMGARDAQSFLALLVRRYGTIMRAWRNGLDLDGNGRISYYEFCKAARAIGYESSLRQLWNDLNENDDKAFITLDELDQDTFDRVNYFNDLITARFSSLKEAWSFFDHDKQNQLYEKQFRSVLVDKLSFDTGNFDIGQLYKDLDYDGNGFLTMDDWLFLKKWVTSNDCKMLDEFRKVLRSKYFKPTDAFYKVFDINRNGSIDPKEFVDGCRKLNLPREGSCVLPRRLFELLDADESGEISVSEFVRLFTADNGEEENKNRKAVTAIDEHNPLPAIERELQSRFGCVLDLEELQAPLKKSFQLYEAVYRRLEETERTDLHELVNFNWEETNGSSSLSADMIQDIPDLDMLLEQAAKAQLLLKRVFLKEDVAKAVTPAGLSQQSVGANKNRTSSASKSGGAAPSSSSDGSRRKDSTAPFIDWDEFQRKMDAVWPSRTTSSCSGILKVPFLEAHDPGIKSHKRCVEKAAYKYAEKYGQQKYRRVRDISRLSLHFAKCRDLLAALKNLRQLVGGDHESKNCKIISIDNRMRYPTALGWRDFAALVLLEVEPGKRHICEIQLQLLPFTAARSTAHTHYRVLREKIPKLVPNKQAEALQEAILESLQAVRKSEFCSHVTVGVDMDRSKVWSMPWQHNPIVLGGASMSRAARRAAKLENNESKGGNVSMVTSATTGTTRSAAGATAGAGPTSRSLANTSSSSTRCYPAKRPYLPIVSMRTEWMRGNMHGSFPPPVPDLRDNRPWLPAGGLLNGLFTNLSTLQSQEDYQDFGRESADLGGEAGAASEPVRDDGMSFEQKVAELEKKAAQSQKRQQKFVSGRSGGRSVVQGMLPFKKK